jgi:hypothetical protein
MAVKVFLGLASLVLAYYGFWRVRGEYLHSVDNTDLLYLAALYRDLSSHAFSLQGWSLTPAPYFLPDMLFFFIASAVTPDLPSAYSLYAAIYLTCMLGSFYWIARRVASSRSDRILVVGFVALLMSALCRPHGPHDSPYAFVMHWVLAPTGHGGGLLTGIVLIELGVQLLERLTLGRLMAFVLLDFAAIFSDRLTLTEFLLPLIIGSTIVLLLKRRWTPLLALLVIGISSFLALKSADAYIAWTANHGPIRIPVIVPFVPTAGMRAEIWGKFVRDWKEIAGPASPVFILLVTSIVAASIVTAREYRGRRKGSEPKRQMGLGIFLLIVSLSCVSAVAVPIRMCYWANTDNFRYSLALLGLPPLLLTLCGAAILTRFSARSQVVAAGATFILGVVFWLPALKVPPVDGNEIFDGALVKFVDDNVIKHGLHHGYGEYWASRKIVMASKTAVMINVIDDVDEPPRFWVDNPNHWCKLPARSDEAYPVYDFILALEKDQQNIVSHFGPPAALEELYGYALMIYNRPTDVAFRNLGRVAAIDAANARLPSQVGRPKILNHLKFEATAWNSDKARVIAPGTQLVLKIEPAIGGDLLQVMTNTRYAYHLEFRNGSTPVGAFNLPGKAGSGLHIQYVPLRPITGGKPFDLVIITPPPGSGEYSVGTFVVLPDPVLSPNWRKPN